MKNQINKKAFSILEIIVVLGILILTINIAFSGSKILLKNSRDTQRLSSLGNIEFELDNLITQNNILPEPEGGINITSDGEIINIQGYISDSVIELESSEFIDPLDGKNYTYAVNKERDKFQLIGLLENNWYEKENINYKKRLPYTFGNDLGIFLKLDDNTPIQEYTKSDLETNDDLSKYITYINNEEYAVGKDIKRQMSFRINPIANCLHILKSGSSNGDGIYKISPDMMNSFDVYCDMTTDGGGWTLFYANNGLPDSPIEESYVEMRQDVINGKVYELSDYSQATLAGLRDYRYFTNNGSKEILIKNNASTEDKWGKIYFDSSDTLEWALGDKVLGEGKEKCIDLPEGASWGVTDNIEETNYSGLTQIMAHSGDNWGISHEKYDCNGYIETSILPHLAFYNANSSDIKSRARSSLLVGGTWGGENQYRYFIR